MLSTYIFNDDVSAMLSEHLLKRFVNINNGFWMGRPQVLWAYEAYELFYILREIHDLISLLLICTE